MDAPRTCVAREIFLRRLIPRQPADSTWRVDLRQQGKGLVKIPVASNQGRRVVELQNTLFVLDLRTNLVSQVKIADRGHMVLLRRDSALVTDGDGNVRVEARRRGNLYYLQEEVDCAGAVSAPSRSDLWK